jgi:RNA polymerase sigma-70 factor (ECF subfamily)
MLCGHPRLRRWEDTDDVCQSALLRLWRALEKVPLPTVLDFFRLAAWHIRNELISLSRHYFGPEGLATHHASTTDKGDGTGPSARGCDPPASTHDPDRLASWTEFHRQVDGLPPAERDVFELLWYHGLDLADAAAVLGVSYEAAKKRWQSARRKLYDLLKGEIPG